MPALTVSTSTPVASAGEYGDTRFAKGGSGCGGAGRRLAFCGNKVGAFPPFFFAGCFPLLDVGALVVGTAGTTESDRLVYGGRGILSGFKRCIWNEIISNSCLSVGGGLVQDVSKGDGNALVLITLLMSRPSFFHCTRTRPGFCQSRGWDLLTSCRVPSPRRLVASAMSLLRGHQTLFSRAILRSPLP